MSILILESFDEIAADTSTVIPELQSKGWNVNGVLYRVASTTPRHAGSQYLDTANATRLLWTTFPAAATMYMGGAVRIPSGHGITAATLMAFRDGTTAQVEVRMNGTGNLIVTRNGTQIGATGSAALSVDTWYYIEFRTTTHDSTGSFEVRLDGVSEITGSGLDTKNTANATVSAAYYGSNVGGSNGLFLDDLYVSDSAFLGPIRVACLVPNGNGNSSDLVGSDGNSTDNYLLVDDQMTEGFANGDTDYVQSDVVGDHDTYAMSNLPTVPTSILAVQSSIVARADDAGAKGVRIVTRSGGTDYESGTFNLASSYQYFRHIREVDPNTSVAWTESGVNSMEVGMKVQS